ncbi:CYTH domain-containing protein [Oleiagrimonas sp. C23AA]|uniref:CYTH domain-containing protein n=1 Tax=Oleiagrimonas sp. C23AA TaxID=2719047 RepID=UPI00141F2268|nr:CYTH domain-containing protein [Oleiagrimonas sp. C23AA]NII10402.1 CYTH domain-containing protein [Oleiagrimonas sp. C23AA]
MGIEIERKFLLAGDGWRDHVERSQHMAQGYLVDAAAIGAGHARSSVRVRLAGDQAWLNIKSATAGIERQEFEYAIAHADGRYMLETLCNGVIEKMRHFVRVEGTLFELDVFEGSNAGLAVAEVELPSVDAPFPHPDWLGREVSQLSRYYNHQLIAYPYSQWSEAERRAEDA